LIPGPDGDTTDRAAGLLVAGRRPLVRRIGVLTATRAEYGLLSGLLQEIEQRPDMELQLLVTGAHLAPAFDHTVGLIEADGFRASATMEVLLSSDTGVGAAKSLALAVMGVAEALDRLRPDVLVLLGDRYETLAAAEAALLLGVPVAHIGGGESSEGAIDESLRHAVTKLSHLHFVAAEPFARRVVQLGEEPGRVHVVGALGIDNIVRLPLLDRARLEEDLGIQLGKPTILVTYHPVTLSRDGTAAGLEALLAALDAWPRASVVVTAPNADPGGHSIRRQVERYAAARRGPTAVVGTLGQLRYLSLLRLADVVLGNSSSGIIEAPALGTPTVNVGDRQRGRLRARSVIDAAATPAAVLDALSRALTPARPGVDPNHSPYGDGGAATRIADLLFTTPADGLLGKRFHPLFPESA
jgi:UDP-N-acetylglucosamine 2-epimerase (non-hydrolysing)